MKDQVEPEIWPEVQQEDREHQPQGGIPSRSAQESEDDSHNHTYIIEQFEQSNPWKAPNNLLPTSYINPTEKS